MVVSLRGNCCDWYWKSGVRNNGAEDLCLMKGRVERYMFKPTCEGGPPPGYPESGWSGLTPEQTCSSRLLVADTAPHSFIFTTCRAQHKNRQGRYQSNQLFVHPRRPKRRRGAGLS